MVLLRSSIPNEQTVSRYEQVHLRVVLLFQSTIVQTSRNIVKQVFTNRFLHHVSLDDQRCIE